MHNSNFQRTSLQNDEDVAILLLDVETTGLNPGAHYSFQVGIFALLLTMPHYAEIKRLALADSLDAQKEDHSSRTPHMLSLETGIITTVDTLK